MFSPWIRVIRVTMIIMFTRVLSAIRVFRMVRVISFIMIISVIMFSGLSGASSDMVIRLLVVLRVVWIAFATRIFN